MKLVPALVLGLVALASCTSAGADVESQEANTNTSSTTHTSTTTSSSTRASSSSSTATTSAGSSSTTAGGSSSSSAASTVHTDGGDVTVRAEDGQLEVVEVLAAPGWHGDHRLEAPDRLVVSFERDGGRVEVTIELTPTGIVTNTRSVSTG